MMLQAAHSEVSCEGGKSGHSPERCLEHPKLLTACALLIQATHDCSHAPLLQSASWKEQAAIFSATKFLLKLVAKAGHLSLWQAVSAFISLADILFMIVFVREYLLAQRLEDFTTRDASAMVDADLALERYGQFAESICEDPLYSICRAALTLSEACLTSLCQFPAISVDRLL